MMSLVHRVLKTAARFALHHAGGLRLIRYSQRAALRIITYHHFPDGCLPALAAQCEYLRRYYHPVSLSFVANWLAGTATLPPNAVAVTIDDGYRDFLYAQPVFSKYSISVTVFLVSDFIDGDWLWFDRLFYIIRHTPATSITVPGADGTKTYPLRSASDRETAAIAAAEDLKTLPNQMRCQYLRERERDLGVQVPEHRPADCAALSWSEIRSLRQQAVEFGVHTRTHPILSRVETESELRAEIEVPKERLSNELGEAPAFFCYPNGQPSDFDERVIRIVRNADYKMAVTTQLGLNAAGCDPYRLRRLWTDTTPPDAVFEELLAGVHTHDRG